MSSSLKIIKNSIPGKDDLHQATLPPRRRQIIALAAILVLFLILSFVPDHLWSCKKTYLFSQRSILLTFANMNHLNMSQIYGKGGAWSSQDSFYYLAAAKIMSIFVKNRLFCLRLVSVISSTIYLFILFLITARLFYRNIALLFLFLLVTSPISLESMRSFGYIPLSALICTAAIYLLISTMNNRHLLIKIFSLALLSTFTLSMYVSSRILIILVIVSFLLFHRYKIRVIALFLGLMASIIILSNSVFKDVHFNLFQNLWSQDAEWLKGGASKTSSLGKLILNNSEDAWNYIANIERIPFTDEDKHSRLFSFVYTPFFLLGILISLLKGKRGNIFLLLWFSVFFFPPLLSSHIDPRRIILSLPAIYLFITLGLYFFFTMIHRIVRDSSFRFILYGLIIAIIIIPSLYGIFEYIHIVSKPYYNYSQKQLKTVAKFLIAQLENGATIFYNIPTRDLIWGNSYFINHMSQPELGYNIKRYVRYRGQGSLEEIITDAILKGKNLGFLWTFPHTTPYYTVEHYHRLFNSLNNLASDYGPNMIIERIPATKMYYISSVAVAPY